MKSKKTLYIILLLLAVLPLIGDLFSHQVALRDTRGISAGMTMDAFHAKFAEGELFEFDQYGCYVNNMGYHVIVTHDQNTVKTVEVLDQSKLDRTTKGFEKLVAGMTLHEVGRIVGIPAAADLEDPNVLYYLCADETTYMLTYQATDNGFVLTALELVKAEES